MKGRGEYIRLLFEVAKVPYVEVNDPPKILALTDMTGKSGSSPTPAYAPPLVVGPDDFCQSQSVAICARLGKRFGLFPASEADEYKALQIALSVADFHTDGRMPFHPLNYYGSYYDQEEEAKVSVAEFVKNDGRLSKWLNHFEHLFSVATSNFVVGPSLTYVDILVFHVLSAAAQQFPEAWAVAPNPLSKAFIVRIASIEAIVEYQKSSRCRPFEGNSMM